MADITNYKTLQAYVDATLAEDGGPGSLVAASRDELAAIRREPRKKKQTSRDELAAIRREPRKKKKPSKKGPR